MSPSDFPDRKVPAHFPAEEHQNRAVIHFVTICTKDRLPLLANEAAHRILLTTWNEPGTYFVGRYVVMPDHLHFFCAPAQTPPPSLGQWMNFWKSRSAKSWPAQMERKLWQRDYWDTQMRRGESYSQKWEYVRNNPVRAGLVSKAEEWPYQGEIYSLEWHD